jgi:hypothetical protein
MVKPKRSGLGASKTALIFPILVQSVEIRRLPVQRGGDRLGLVLPVLVGAAQQPLARLQGLDGLRPLRGVNPGAGDEARPVRSGIAISRVRPGELSSTPSCGRVAAGDRIMTPRHKLPIGIQSFSKLREGGYYYVNFSYPQLAPDSECLPFFLLC